MNTIFILALAVFGLFYQVRIIMGLWKHHRENPLAVRVIYTALFYVVTLCLCCSNDDYRKGIQRGEAWPI
ncbi:hypothetical protein [Pantoea agglomerans]|uniref:hypothetical protein n=1 Tax=Enterobacter agglomerans TaxID=549 RepID=UPI0012DB4AE3|nr:hypothetical protein [Pantoea agglomerans]